MISKIGIIPISYAKMTVTDICPNCLIERELNLQLIQNALVIGFPVFPTTKAQKCTCSFCEQIVSKYQLSLNNLKKVNHVVSLKKPSPLYFSFGFVILFLFLFALTRDIINKNAIN